MTASEAHTYLEDFQSALTRNRCLQEIIEANGVAISALEKQIPKKPTYEGDGYADGVFVYDRAICPCCGNDDFEYDINNWGCKFCPDCGQALDWSDTE